MWSHLSGVVYFPSVSGSNVPLRLDKAGKSEIGLLLLRTMVIATFKNGCHLSQLPRFWECIGGEGGVNDRHDRRQY